ncbi:MAG: hypothetical protein ABWW69_03515 [Pyrodictiaceae archaeon]
MFWKVCGILGVRLFMLNNYMNERLVGFHERLCFTFLPRLVPGMDPSHLLRKSPSLRGLRQKRITEFIRRERLST